MKDDRIKYYSDVYGVDLMNLFPPTTGRDLRYEYPELNKIEEFKSLTANEMLYVYYYTMMYSDENNERMRIAKSIFMAFSGRMSEDDKEKWLSGNIPEKVRVACKRASAFDFSARIKSKKSKDVLFENLNKMINVDITTFTDEEGNIDVDRQNKYVAMAERAIQMIDKLIVEKETEFGIRDDIGTTTNRMLIEEWHKKKRESS